MEDGPAAEAKLREPLGLAFGLELPQASPALYIADGGNRRVRVLALSVEAEPLSLSTLNGTGGMSDGAFVAFEELAEPSDVAVSADGRWMVSKSPAPPEQLDGEEQRRVT